MLGLKCTAANLENAYADFNKASQVDGTNAEAYLGMVSILPRQKNMDLALTMIDVSLTVLKADRWMLKEKKADIHIELGQLDLAEETYTEMIQTENEHIQGRAYYHLGNLELKKGEKEKAYQHWLSASDLYYYEADECLEKYCGDLLQLDQDKAENKMITSYEQKAKQHQKSAIIKKLFGKIHVIDLNKTLQSNEQIDQAPKAILDAITKYLSDMTFLISYHGLLVVNKASAPIRLVYEVEEETSNQITLHATAVDQSTEKTIVIRPDSNGFVLSGLADAEADLDLVFATTSSLPPSIKKQLNDVQSSNKYDYLHMDWNAIL